MQFYKYKLKQQPNSMHVGISGKNMSVCEKTIYSFKYVDVHQRKGRRRVYAQLNKTFNNSILCIISTI